MSEEMKQGETYEEVLTEETEEESSGGNNDKVKLLAIIAVVAVIIIAALVIVISKKPGKEKNNEDSDFTYQDDGWEDTDTYTDDEFFSDENTETPEYVSSGSYDAEQIASLRKWGYTGDEIEFYMNSGVTYESLLETAKEQRKEAEKETIAELGDIGTKAYKQLMRMTWLVGKEFKVKKINLEGEDAGILEYEALVENVDYVKCPPRGKQLFIRITLDDGTYAFMTVPPERWVTMKQKGNIVVDYTLETYGNCKVITNITEREQGVDFNASDSEQY